MNNEEAILLLEHLLARATSGDLVSFAYVAECAVGIQHGSTPIVNRLAFLIKLARLFLCLAGIMKQPHKGML